MGRAGNRTLAWAVALSLLLHLLLVVPAAHFLARSPVSVDFPIQVRLVPAPVRRPPPPPRHPRPVRKAIAHRTAAKRHAPPTPPPVPTAEAGGPPAVRKPPAAAKTEPAPAPVYRYPPLPVPEPLAAEAPPRNPAIRELPKNLVITYAVQLGGGDNGFVAGRATYVWHYRDGRYSMVSTVEATGVVSLFVGGRIVEVSMGRVTGGGLQPDQYWLERGRRKQDSARFDWALDQVVLSSGDSRPLKAQAQDLLSFPFQLALTAHPGEPDFVLWVTDGRKFRGYHFHIVGKEPVDLPGGPVTALHLQGTRAGEGRLDVWLDLARSGVPVRIQATDQKGSIRVLRLESISTPETAPDRSGD